MTTDTFIGWLHDLRYSRMVCMLLPTDAVMAYPIPAVRCGERMLIIPLFETAEEAYQPCGFIVVPCGGERIIAYSAAQWLGFGAEGTMRLYSGDAQSMDAYYSRLAAWKTPDAEQCEALQHTLLNMLEPGLAGFYKSLLLKR